MSSYDRVVPGGWPREVVEEPVWRKRQPIAETPRRKLTVASGKGLVAASVPKHTVDGRTIKPLDIVDDFTRESPVMLTELSIEAGKAIETLERLYSERGTS